MSDRKPTSWTRPYSWEDVHECMNRIARFKGHTMETDEVDNAPATRRAIIAARNWLAVAKDAGLECPRLIASVRGNVTIYIRLLYVLVRPDGSIYNEMLKGYSKLKLPTKPQ